MSVPAAPRAHHSRQLDRAAGRYIPLHTLRAATHVQSADNDPFMPDVDREGLNTVRLSRGDDIVEVRALTTWATSIAPCASTRPHTNWWQPNNVATSQLELLCADTDR